MIVVFALAQLADGVSAVAAVLSRPEFREINLLPGALLERPEWALIVKIAGIIFVMAAIVIIDRVKPRLAGALLGLGIVAGVIGLISNLVVLV